MRIDLVVTPSWVYVYGSGKADVILERGLRTRNPQAFWQNKKRKQIHDSIPLVDEYWHLYDRSMRRFPKGVVRRAAHLLKDAGLRVQLSTESRDILPSREIYLGHGLEVDKYPWQVKAPADFLRQEFGVCSVPTRGGKTIIGLRAATAFAVTTPVLYLVNKVEAQRSIIEHWSKHFAVAPAYDDVVPMAGGLHVVTYQSAANRPLDQYGMVIGDEIHGVGADTFFDAVMRCESAWYRLGLTGTSSGRSDGKDLWIEAAAGPLICDIPRKVVMDAGLCARGVVWQVPVHEPLPDVSGWRDLEAGGIINEYRNERLIECGMAAWEALENEGQLLVMVQKHEHGKMFSGQLSAVLGQHVPYVCSKTPSAQRKHYYDALRDGSMKAIVASSIWNDSVTLPHVRVLIIAPGGKSPIRTRQILGRALTGDKKVIIVDAKDTGHPTLKRHASARRKAFQEDGYEVLEWQPK